MIAGRSIYLGQIGHSTICIVDVDQVLCFGDKPYSVIHDIPSEECQGGIGCNGLDSSIHALFQADRGVAVRVTVRSSGIRVVPRGISRGIRSAANWFRAAKDTVVSITLLSETRIPVVQSS